jgi:hypothetical protein
MRSHGGGSFPIDKPASVGDLCVLEFELNG